MEIDWLLVAVALGVGALVGLTGVGAGAIMTPVLVGFFGVSLPVAIATDLFFATLTKLIGVPLHHRQGSIDWPMTRVLWRGSVPGTLVGVALVMLVVSREQTEWLLWPLALIVLLTSLTLGRRAISGAVPAKALASPRRVHPIMASAGGFGIGGAVALTSVGAGALGMALLVRLSPTTVKPRELVGTDLVHAIPIALIAGVAYGIAGFVSLPLLFTMLMGSIPGVIIGSFGAGRISARVLNGGLSLILFAAVVLVVVRGIS